MEIDQIIPSVDDKIKSTINHYLSELNKTRTGRAHTGLLDHLKIDYYGSKTHLNQIAVLSLADSQTITIKPHEKNMLPVIDKAIAEANLGITGVTRGDLIMVKIPPLTEDRRKELVKQIKKTAEEIKITIRNIRRDGNHSADNLVKNKTISEDDNKKVHDQIQVLVNNAISQVDDITKNKEKELMTL